MFTYWQPYRLGVVLKPILCFLLVLSVFQYSVRAEQPESKVDNLINSMSAISGWLTDLKSAVDSMPRGGDSTELIACTEMVKKSLKKLQIDQEDFLESISATRVDITRVRNNINALRGSIAQLRDNIQPLNALLKLHDKSLGDQIENGITTDVTESLLNLDVVAQVSLGIPSTTFDESKNALIEQAKRLLANINTAGQKASDLYKSLQARR